MESSHTVPGDADTATEAPKLGPLFKPFDWLPADMREASPTASASLRLSHKVSDLARGVQLVLEILERDEMTEHVVSADEAENRRLFNGYHRGVLLRLAIASADAILGEAEVYADWVQKYGNPKAAA